MEALINDQQLFKARREYEQKEAAAKAAEAAERCTTIRGWTVSIWTGQWWQPNCALLLHVIPCLVNSGAVCPAGLQKHRRRPQQGRQNGCVGSSNAQQRQLRPSAAAMSQQPSGE